MFIFFSSLFTDVHENSGGCQSNWMLSSKFQRFQFQQNDTSAAVGDLRKFNFIFNRRSDEFNT